MGTEPGASPEPRSPEQPRGEDDPCLGRSRENLYDEIQEDGQRLAAGLIMLLHAMSDQLDLNPTAFQCYVLLRLYGPMTPSEIAGSLKLATGSVTGVIDRLEEHGIAQRDRHPQDRRKVVVELKERAGALGGGSTTLGMREAMVALHDQYTAEQLETIADWLKRIGTVLTDVASGTRAPG